MEADHSIVQLVHAAKSNPQTADDLIRQYLPFIKAETAKFLHRPPIEGHDDELSISMFAFYEAAMAYEQNRGSFLKLAALAIRRRLIDYQRRERKHTQTISLDQSIGDEDDGHTLLDQLDTGRDEISEKQSMEATQGEIQEFAKQLAEFGISLTDVADNCPKQERTLSACQKVLAYGKTSPSLLERFLSSHKLPIAELSSACGIERKTLERHRKYLAAILLAYTNGYEIIRGHLYRIGR